MKTCKDCGTEIPAHRSSCVSCARKRRWAVMENNEMGLLFPPRIVKTLQQLKTRIKVNTTDLGGLFLYGPAGTGKTIYAAACLMEMKRLSFYGDGNFIHGGFVNVLNLLEELRASFNQQSNNNSADEIITRYSQVDVLILDDISAQKTTDWVLNTLTLIINNRYESLLPTIITSNADLESLANQLGDDRIPSRICEMCKIKQFKNKDLRIQRNETR